MTRLLLLLRGLWDSRTVTISLVAMLCAAIVLFAQRTEAQSVSGSISGNVVDATKQVVPGALVTLLMSRPARLERPRPATEADSCSPPSSPAAMR